MLQTASRRRRVVLKPRTTSDETLLQATSYRPQAGFLDSPDEADWPGRDPGPCRKRSVGSAVADVQTLERRGRFQTFPCRQRVESLAWRFYGLQATGHVPILPPPTEEAAAGRRGVIFRKWDVGRGRWGVESRQAATRHQTSGLGNAQNPHPGPPQRGGRLVRCEPQPRASCRRHNAPRTTHHVLRTTYHLPTGRTHGSAPTTG